MTTKKPARFRGPKDLKEYQKKKHEESMRRRPDMLGVSQQKKYYSYSNMAYDEYWAQSRTGSNAHAPSSSKKEVNDNTTQPNKTIKKEDNNTNSNYSTPKVGPVANPLFRYATFNALFTLSALNQADITNAQTLMSSANPHDIIVRSGGIGNDVRSTASAGKTASQESYFTSDLAKEAYARSKKTLDQGLDMYFSNVTINSIPPMNSDRRLTSVTKIEMEIIEPLGLTLLDKIRGAAANCGYLDHVDAPYLLSLEFMGFNEEGIGLTSQPSEKRRIPIKITNIRLNVNAGQTTYNLTAVAYNEFAYMNRYNYLRGEGAIDKGQNMAETLKNFEEQLNQVTQQESEQNEFAEEGKHDTFEITVDPEFASEYPDPAKLEIKNFFVRAPSSVQKRKRNRGQTKIAEVKTSDAIITILQSLMKTLPRFEDGERLDNFLDKVGASVASNGDSETFYYDYFAIDSNVVPQADKFCKIRGTHPKLVKYHIYPHRIHAYVVAQPGTSTGVNFNPFVRKEYNYIYTGDNVDILDLDIDYKVAYYQTKLKDVEATGGEAASKEDENQTSNPQSAESRDVFVDPPFIYKTEPGVVRTMNGAFDKVNKLDQLFDAIANPTADMVNIRMTILGDPAWLGQTQFIPANPITQGSVAGGAKDVQKLQTTMNERTIWNNTFRNFNANYAEPLIRLNFKTPVDFNPMAGTYNLDGSENIAFSGLYRVVGCVSTFADGKFTQELNLVRCKHQGLQAHVGTKTTFKQPSIHLNGGVKSKLTQDQIDAFGGYGKYRYQTLPRPKIDIEFNKDIGLGGKFEVEGS